MTTRLTVAARTDVGRVRDGNEDAFLIADIGGGLVPHGGAVVRFEVGPRGALLAVSDGMGGHNAGEVAATMGLASVHRSLVDRTSVGDVDQRVTGAVEQANADVFAAGRRPSLANMGATMTAVLIDGSDAHIAEVGDSRAYILRGGTLRQVTKDQSYVQVLVDAGALSPKEASASSLRNMLFQAIGGTAPEVVVALGTLALRQRDCLVLCSDGLTNKVTDDELRDLILQASSLDAAVDALVALANDRGGEDNITVLLAGVGGDVPIAPAGESISDTYRVLCSFEPPLRK